MAAVMAGPCTHIRLCVRVRDCHSRDRLALALHLVGRWYWFDYQVRQVRRELRIARKTAASELEAVKLAEAALVQRGLMAPELPPFAGFNWWLGLTPAGVVRGAATDPQKAAENLAKCQLSGTRPPPEADPREKITPEEALREAMFDADKAAELLTGEKSPLNSEVWRAAANKPLSYRYMHDVFRIGWCQYWARRIVVAALAHG
jgi:hypothetical protein